MIAICSDLRSPPNSNISFSHNDTMRLRGTVATYTCNYGYQLIGLRNRTCEDSGSGGVWSGSDPSCTGLAGWILLALPINYCACMKKNVTDAHD